MDFFEDRNERLDDLLGRITDAEDTVVSSDQLESTMRESILDVLDELREILSDENKSEDIERWDSMLAQCIEEAGGFESVTLDENAADKLYRCLSEIKREVDASA